jgi:hypothetical protein
MVPVAAGELALLVLGGVEELEEPGEPLLEQAAMATTARPTAITAKRRIMHS